MDASALAGVELRLIEKPAEIEKLAVFNAGIHEEVVGDLTRELALSHPDAKRMRWLAAFDTGSSAIVSTLCLIPWTLLYDGIAIPAGEMGIVGTDKAWRKKGLMRELTAEFNKLLVQDGCLLSHIQGIPYFYRQFGYEYCIPLETQIYLEFRHVKEMQQGPEVELRPAAADDIPRLVEWYDSHVKGYSVASTRSGEHWAYLLDASMKTGYGADTYIVRSGGLDAGYCRIPRQGFGKALIIGECSNLDYDLFPGLFAGLEKMAVEQNKPFIRVNLGPTHPAVLAAKDSGARDAGSYAWQIRVPDPVRFLRKITPALNRRLAAGGYGAYSGELVLNLYREKLLLAIENGKVLRVVASDAPKKPVINIPPNLFAPLVLGQKSFEACRGLYPDLSGGQKDLRLFETLFPQVQAFLYCPY
jgi:hypothetical protein